jgi:hypothetical protein
MSWTKLGNGPTEVTISATSYEPKDSRDDENESDIERRAGERSRLFDGASSAQPLGRQWGCGEVIREVERPLRHECVLVSMSRRISAKH